MKIDFVYKVDDRYWNDGLREALKIISESHEVRLHNGVYKPYIADFVLVWGGSLSEQVKEVAKWPMPKGICFAGGPLNVPILKSFDVVFCETNWHLRYFKRLGLNAKLAFGTNTNLFKPQWTMPKQFDYIYPAAFANWKRHHLFIQKQGRKLAVGYMQPDNWEKECWEVCMNDKDTLVMPMVTPDVMVWLYQQSNAVAVTSDLLGGGERTVLEGLACGCQVEVEEDNPKLLELLEDAKKHIPNQEDYAKALIDGIEEVRRLS